MEKKKRKSRSVFVPLKCFASAGAITLKLRLNGTKSVRVVTLPGNMSMYWFAKIIMDCFGFQEYHLYHFEDKRFNRPERGHGLAAMSRMMDSESERMRREVLILHKIIAEVFPGRGDKAKFLYDYGDGWEVEITRMADRKNAGMFECVKCEGINAYEDIGGCWRLNDAEEMCEKILADPSERKKLNQEESELLEWLGGDNEKHFVANLCCFLAVPSLEDITEILRDYNDSDMLKGFVPEFYDELYDGDIIADLSLDEEDGEEDN